MDQILRKFASLWNPAQPDEDEENRRVSVVPASVAADGGFETRPNGHDISSHASVSSTAAALGATTATAISSGTDFSDGTAAAVVATTYVSSSDGSPSEQRIGNNNINNANTNREKETRGEKPPAPTAAAATAATAAAASCVVRPLSYPWGTSNPSPPVGWFSAADYFAVIAAASSPSENFGSGNSSSTRARVTTTAVQLGSSRRHHQNISHPAGCSTPSATTTMTTTTAAMVAYISGTCGGEEALRRSAKVNKTTINSINGKGGYSNSINGSSRAPPSSTNDIMTITKTKRQRDAINDKQEGEEDDDGLLQQQQQQQQQRRQAVRRRTNRTCPADSTFISPVQVDTRSDGRRRQQQQPPRAVGAATALSRNDDERNHHDDSDSDDNDDAGEDDDGDDDGQEEFQRDFPPSHLIFRAGLMKVLRGGKAVAVRRARSAAKLRRRTRELHAIIVRHTSFHASRAASQGEGDGAEGGRDADAENQQLVRDNGRGGKKEGRRRSATSVSRAIGRLSGKGDGALAAEGRLLVIEGENEVRQRVNRLEEEQSQAAEEKAASRARRLQKLRAEARAAFQESQDAHASLLASASAALNASSGADMETLRKIFDNDDGDDGDDGDGGGSDARGDQPSALRFKGDVDVERLQQQYEGLEKLLEDFKAAQLAGDLGELERLLSKKGGVSRLRTQKEFLSASQALRVGKERAAQYQAEQAAKTARAAAAAAVAEKKALEAEARDEQQKAVAKAEAAARKSAAEAAAEEEEEEEVGALRASREAKQTFLEDVERLKAEVERRGVANQEILTSPDPGVKKTRIAFKKSYQGCLNKLSSQPSAVASVVRDIHGKAEAPLGDAQRTGWGDKATDFLYFNLADKLVSYSERDHFSAESYRMAFPLACVAVDLMSKHPGLSELFLGTLYSRCPSAVPALSFDTAGKSDEEMMALFGKRQDEDIPSFLSRTKGLVVLMAAVVQTPPDRRGGGGGGAGAIPHSLPLAEGWRWLARFVNGLAAYSKQNNPPPIPTGPVLEWFFKMAGFELQRRYGKALDKVVQTVKTEILPILLPKSMVPHLLDVVVEDYESRGRRFFPPAGREKEFSQFRAWGET